MKEYVRSDGSLISLCLNGVHVTNRDGEKFIWSIVEDISECQQTAEVHEERRITATTRVAAGDAGLARFRLVCIALGFHTSLHGTAT